MELTEILKVEDDGHVLGDALHDVEDFEFELGDLLHGFEGVHFLNLVVEAFRLEFGHVYKVEFCLYEELCFHIISVRVNLNLHLEIADIVNLNLLITVPDDKCPCVEGPVALLHIPRVCVHAVRPFAVLHVCSSFFFAQDAFLNF